MKKIMHEHQTEIIFDQEEDFYRTEEYLEYRKLWNERPIKKEAGNFPVNIDVSVTNACNLKCRMCKRTITMADEKLRNKQDVIESEIAYLDFQIFKKVIDEGAENGLKAVHLTGHDGEPTLHEQLPEMIAYSRKKGIVDVFSHSNATLLHKENRIDRILKAAPHRFIFSVDSPKKETYESIRIGAKYEVVIENIKRFIKRKKELGLAFPIVKVQMVVMEQNKDEVELFKNLFHDELGADVLGFTEFVNYHGIIENSEAQISYATSGTVNTHYVCDYPYRRIRLDQNNLVYACLTGQYHKLGDAQVSSIKEMWNGPYMQELRRKHLEVGAGITPGCEKCGRQWTSSGIITPEVKVDIVEQGYEPVKNIPQKI